MMLVSWGMRTTINLDEDVAAAIEQLRRERRLGLSEALNLLARQGLMRQQRVGPYVHQDADLGMRVDVSNIGDVLDILDEE